MTRESEIAELIGSMYSARATGYDAENRAWHVELGLEFVEWVKPERGDAVLDLACGTGLVAIPAAEAVGTTGLVVGVDLTAGMLEEAKKKTGSAKIEWIQHDVTDLAEVGAVQRVVQQRGGFNIISCCSALALLPDPVGAIKYWSTLLKPGGKMIIDVPTEDKTLQFLINGPLRDAVGPPLPLRREWITDVHSLERVYEEAGLEVVRSWRTRSYLPERWYEEHERDEAFEQQMKVYSNFERDGKVDEAREAFKPLWKEILRDNGKLWDGHALYITIGRKPGGVK